jgi:hypothetical protein
VTGKRILHRKQRLAVGQGGRYRLVGLIDEDWLGQVWHGKDTLVGAAVTIRLVSQSLTQDRARVAAFRNQLNVLNQRLDHPNIAWVYYHNYGQDGPIEFVVMAELRGQTLAHRLKREPGLQLREGFAIGAAIAEGLQAAHDVGFVHGALTTQSIMLSDDGSVKIMDFGTAALRPASDVEGPAGDVRWLGKILLELIGPSRGGTAEPASAQGVDVELSRLWEASLDADPARRPSAESLASALRDAAQAGPIRPVRPLEAAETPVQTERDRSDPAGLLPQERNVDELGQQERTLAADESRGEASGNDAPVAEPAAWLTPQGANGEVERARLEAEWAEEVWKAEERRPAVEAQGATIAEEAARAEETLERGEHRGELDDATTSKPARAEQARLIEDGRRGEEAARGMEEPAAAATEPGVSLGGGARVPGVEPQTTDEAELAPPPERPLAMDSAGPSAPVRVSPRRSSARPLPRGRSWLLLGVLFLVAAVLGFLLSRPETEPRQTPQNIPQDTIGSEAIVMPDLRGLTYAEALTRIEATGLALDRRVEALGESGIVVATDPGLGQLVRPGTAVTVYVGADPPDESAVASF